MPGFAPAIAPEDPLVIERVTITLTNAPGVIPCSQIPPGYEFPADEDFNVATGFLENGNQRFFHRHR
jgi:hypothetical protein